jgi:hypothetical protein
MINSDPNLASTYVILKEEIGRNELHQNMPSRCSAQEPILTNMPCYISKIHTTKRVWKNVTLDYTKTLQQMHAHEEPEIKLLDMQREL